MKKKTQRRLFNGIAITALVLSAIELRNGYLERKKGSTLNRKEPISNPRSDHSENHRAEKKAISS